MPATTPVYLPQLASLLTAMAVCCAARQLATAQQATPPAPEEASVKLSFPNQMDLNLLIDYVSQRLGIKILYDQQVVNKQITIKAPGEIPTASLLNVLESALRINGLALVEGDVPGWKQIIVVKDLSRIAQPNAEGLGGVENTEAVTQAFPLKFVTPEKLATIVKPFLTEPGANTITVPEQNLLIITDYAGNLKRIAKLVEAIDQAGPPSELSFYTVKNLEAGGLAQQIREALTAKFKTQNAPLVYEVTRHEIDHSTV